jgi:sec-independent protein translocase protein TatC
VSTESDHELPLTQHLRELRDCLLKVIAAWILCAIAAWFYREQIFSFLLEPAISALGAEEARLQAIKPTEIFFTYLKCAALAGFIISLPVIFWQFWSFVAPGLYKREKKVVAPFVLSSTLLFVGGGGFGYVFVFPLVFQFFQGFSAKFVESAWTMGEVFSFTTHMFMAFGIAFEMPVVVVSLAMVGIVTPKKLLAFWPYAILICFILGAVLTPQDVVSQALLAGPLVALYFIGVGVSFMVARTPRAL